MALTPPAGAAEKAIWGPATTPGGGSAFPIYRELGVDTLQFALDWAATAPVRPTNPTDPADPAYRWPAQVDNAVREARRTRITVALAVTRSPAWANRGRPAIWAPEPAHYADFLRAASRRYPSVWRWMIWIEPDRADRFQPNQAGSPIGPRAYAVLLEAAYSALKGVRRRNIVIGGMTWTGGTVKPARFLRSMRLPNGRRPRLDWYGHNPFPFRFPNLRAKPISGGWRDISDLDTFGRELRRVYGHPGPRLWLSEFTIQSDKRSRDFTRFVSRAAQARWLAAAYRIADQLRSVAGLGWLGLMDEPEAPGSVNWGLLTATGARKPAYAAFRRAPSRRFRPAVRLRRRGSRLSVRVRPRARGRLRVELHAARGRAARTTRRVRSGIPVVVSLRLRRRARHVLVIRAPRAERVVRRLTGR